MSKYTIEVSITPLCCNCGQELVVSMTESKSTGHPFERDDPYERKDRRVFIEACDVCYEYKGTRK